MTTLTRSEIRNLLDHGWEDYLEHCALTYFQCGNREIQDDIIRRYASHCDVLAGHESPLDPETKALVAHYLQSHAETL